MLRRGWDSGRRYRRTDSGTGQFLFLQARDNIPQSFPLYPPLPRSLNLFIPPPPPPSLPLLPYNRISPTTYLFTEHLMVKINYKWNAEMRNPGRHADNDGGSVRRTGWGRGEVAGGRGQKGGRTARDGSEGGTITSDRSIIDSGEATRSISVQLCPYQYPDSYMKEGGAGPCEPNTSIWRDVFTGWGGGFIGRRARLP